MHVDPLIALFGLGVGVLVGMTGVGGGSLMTPVLILVFGIDPVTAIGTDLAYGAVTKTLGGWRHWRRGTVDLGLCGWMALGSVPASALGVVALKSLQGAGRSFDDTILTAVGATLLVCGAAMLARRALGRSRRERERAELTAGRRAAAVALGVCFGLVVGVTSAGSGALIAVALIFVFGLSPRRVVGTDVAHAALMLWAAALAHLVAGDVDYALAATILIGSLPGVALGSALSTRVPVGALRTSLGLLLVAAGLALVRKAGLDVPVGVLAAFPLAVAVLLAGAHLRARWQASVSGSASV